MEPQSLVGRERERHALHEFVAVGKDGPTIMAVVGEQGSGRSSIVTLAGHLAELAGRRVLAIAGVPGEERIPLACLSQLLLPFVEQIEALPDAHRSALERPFGLVPGSAPFDLVATGMAVLALMSRRVAPPVFVAVDDADLVDAETLSVLAFVAKRMDRRDAVLLLTSEPLRVPPQFERNLLRVRIRRLTEAESFLVLEQHAPALDGPIRRQVVAQSAGSPLALLETAAAALRTGTPTRPFREPLQVGPLIAERVMGRYRRLPPATRARLVVAAVAETFAWSSPSSAPVLHDELAVMAPAEAQRIVTIDQSGVRFVHPAFWIAIYHATPYTQRVEAHRRVADSLRDRPRQRAWHLGRATDAPDESVARLLEDSAAGIGLQLGRRDEALALERAAELSPDGDESARRYLSAAAVAAPTGELDWVDELTSRAMTCVQDAQLRAQLTTTSAWAAAARGQFSKAMATLSRAAADTVDTAPEAAWEVLSIAAAVGYQSGSRSTQAQMLGAVSRLGAATAPPPTAQHAARAIWIESYLRPGVGTANRRARLERLAGRGPTDEPSLSRLAGAAWLDDETETAFDLADAAYHRLVDEGAHAAAAVIGPIRAATAWDMGRWDDALEFAAHSATVAEAAGGGMLQATGDMIAALVHAARGDALAVEARTRAALDIVKGDECRSVAARVEQARGLSAMAAGHYTEAYGHLSRLFREDGAPLHWHISYFGVPDLAAAALRTDEPDAARAFLGSILDQFPAEPATRMQHLLLRAQALLAQNDDDAEHAFDAARSDPAGSRWPFERAQMLLDHGSWLRRRRRVNEAKPLLANAHNIFESLGANPWAQRAASELRASHVDVPRRSGSLDELTAQQREIVLLAGQGLTNREIAARLYLSPRTVASHLYRSFPKLGIRDRWQLRDVIDRSVRPKADPLEADSVS